MSGSKKCTVCNKGWLWTGPNGGCKTCAARAALQPAVQPEPTTSTANTARPNTTRPQQQPSNQPTTSPSNANTGGRANPTGPISVALGATDTIVLNPRRGNATVELPNETITSPPTINPVPQVQPPVVNTSTPTVTVSPLQTGRPRLAQKNQRLKDALETITNASQQERQQRADETARHISGLTEEQLAGRTPEENVQALAILTSVNVRTTNARNNTYTETTPGPQMAALAKLYENMKLDPDFEEHDKTQRDNILNSIANDPSAQNLSEVNWIPNFRNESNADSQSRLRHLQSLQTAHMPPNMLGNNDQLQLVNNLGDGSSGVCSGKQVKVSADTTKNHSFDETINTVVHETTHAYQNHLTGIVDTMPLDDPRYVQAQMFKFNAMGYCGPPPALPTNPTEQQTSDRERLYKAYRNQPMERHAWQAGNEAGRLFDARAGALDAVETASRVTRFAPDSGQEATALAEQIRTGTNQQRAAAMLDLDALAEQAMGRAATAIEQKLEDARCVDLIGPRAWNGFSRRRVAVLNDHQGKPATRLKTLETVKNELDVAYADGQAKEAKEDEINTISAAISQQLQPADVLRYLGANRWNEINANRVNLVNSRTDPDGRLRQIKQIRDDLGPEIEAAKQALNESLARQAEKDLEARITKANNRIVKLLESEDMQPLRNQFDTYNERRKTLVNAKGNGKQRAADIEQLEADLTTAQRDAAQIASDIIVASNKVVDLMEDDLATEALGGAEAWNKTRARRIALRDGNSDAGQRLSDLRQLQTDIGEALKKARLAEAAAARQLEQCWAIFGAEPLPDPVFEVANNVQNMQPRTSAIAAIKSSRPALDYLKNKGLVL